MIPFTTLTAVAAPLDMAYVDTDRILPARFLRKPRGPDFGRYAFHDLRFDEQGDERPDFVLNRPPFRSAKILVAGANFGCGSSREAAVYALYDFGIRSVIAPSFGDIHYANQLQNGMLPVVLAEAVCRAWREELARRPGATITVDLVSRTVTGPDGSRHVIDLNETHRERLLKGLDDVGLVLKHLPDIERFEARYGADFPWLGR